MPRNGKKGLIPRLKIYQWKITTVEAKIIEKSNGHLIRIETDQEVALAVQSEGGERIYLPGEGGSDTAYYSEDPTFLTETENGYAVLHEERPQKIEIIN